MPPKLFDWLSCSLSTSLLDVAKLVTDTLVCKLRLLASEARSQDTHQVD